LQLSTDELPGFGATQESDRAWKRYFRSLGKRRVLRAARWVFEHLASTLEESTRPSGNQADRFADPHELAGKVRHLGRMIDEWADGPAQPPLRSIDPEEWQNYSSGQVPRARLAVSAAAALANAVVARSGFEKQMMLGLHYCSQLLGAQAVDAALRAQLSADNAAPS
jgi:hypothetical protein